MDFGVLVVTETESKRQKMIFERSPIFQCFGRIVDNVLLEEIPPFLIILSCSIEITSYDSSF